MFQIVEIYNYLIWYGVNNAVWCYVLRGVSEDLILCVKSLKILVTILEQEIDLP